MFTGIVKGVGSVQKIERRPGLHSIAIILPEGTERGVELGASIAVDGVCLTVSGLSGNLATFDVMQQTLAVTTLGQLREGSQVNIERAARANDEVGGHQLSGHIDFLARISKVETPENNHVLSIAVDVAWKKYIFAKGYIAVNGASLTVASFDKESSTFTVWLIPETLRLTTFGQKKVGDSLNIEIDRNTQIIVDSVFAFLEQHLPHAGGFSTLGGSALGTLSDLKVIADK